MRRIKYIIWIVFGVIITAFSSVNTSSNYSIKGKGELVIFDSVTKIVVSKADRKIYAFFGDTFKTYRCAFGANPIGPKREQGDNKTPEGVYYISGKKPAAQGLKALEISYPNADDLAYAQKMGIEPGAGIQIHGLWWPSQDPKTHWMYDWTWGCIAINNQEITELFAWTAVNTPIIITPN